MFTQKYSLAKNAKKLKLAVWQKASPIAGCKPDVWRQDIFGDRILYEDCGQQTKCGWKICYVIPPSRGGIQDLSNLHALHWRNSGGKDGRSVVMKVGTASQLARLVSGLEDYSVGWARLTAVTQSVLYKC